MANPEHLEMLRESAEAWNRWKEENCIKARDAWAYGDDYVAYLNGADLQRAMLYDVDFSGVSLDGANLSWATLIDANLWGASLRGANLREADLRQASLRGANLRKANLRGAQLVNASLANADLRGVDLRETKLQGANLSGTNLTKANLADARFSETVFGNTNLTNVRGLDTCKHESPSTLDHRTLAKSRHLPLAFLRGCGLPEVLIDYLPSLLNQPIQFYSCFISYSTEDKEFAERLHADLQNKGVRCWFAPHQMQGGKKIDEQIVDAIRLYDLCSAKTPFECITE